MSKIHENASEVTAEGGAVLIDGPDGVAVTVTPEAAAETSDRLLHGAAEAVGQQREAERQRRERRETLGHD